MQIPVELIKVCRNCGCVFSKKNRINPFRCPVCMHMEYDEIQGLNF